MRRADSASWRFAEGIEQLPLVTLFVRDTLRLGVPAGADIPPRLDGELPDHSALLDPLRRAEAAALWTGWWRAVVAQEVRGQQSSPGPDQRAWLRQLAAEYEAIFDPPEFTTLANHAALREAVLATFKEAVRWADAQRQALLVPPIGRAGQFDYDTIRSVAEQVARRRRVSPGAVRACAVLVPVEAVWWHRVAPGAVVSSVHAASNPATAKIILADAFESGLASRPHPRKPISRRSRRLGGGCPSRPRWPPPTVSRPVPAGHERVWSGCRRR